MAFKIKKNKQAAEKLKAFGVTVEPKYTLWQLPSMDQLLISDHPRAKSHFVGFTIQTS